MRRFVVPLLATALAFPQAAPSLTAVTALTATKTRVTYAIGPGGGFTLKLEERGTFSRRDHRITVRSEMEVLSPQTGAVIGLVVEEFEEIHIGAAPDTGAFAIPGVPVEEAIIAEWVWEPIEAQGMCWERSLTPASLGSRRYT